VTEFLGGTDLLELLQQRRHLEEDLIFDLFYQAFLAISYLHKTKVMHR
jgi:serine/threonine protein kinase